MKKIKLVTDSVADLTKEEIEKYDIEVVPVIVTVDGVEYKEMDNETYIYKMREAESFSTSQPAIGSFLEVYEKWINLGYSIISIHVSSALSGTFSTAASAASEFENIYVIDTQAVSRGMAFFVEEAYQRIQNNESIEEIIVALNNKKGKVLTYATIDKLDNLVRGGRLKKTKGLLGGLLNIKILVKFFPESLELIDKVRGNKKLLQSLFAHLTTEFEANRIKNVQIIHMLNQENVDLIVEAMQNKFNYTITPSDVFIGTSAIATHAGEGAVGVFLNVVIYNYINIYLNVFDHFLTAKFE